MTKAVPTFWFGLQNTLRGSVLIAMPIARPSKAAWREAITAELRILFGENACSNEWRLQALRQLEDEGRVIWGWSARWRAKACPMTWKDWDALAKQWLGSERFLPGRPEQFSCDHFCEEVDESVRAGALRFDGDYPFDWQPKTETGSVRKGHKR